MSRQGNFHGIVDVEPFGMMIHFFRQQGDSGHEGPGLIKVNEMKGFGQGGSRCLRRLFPVLFDRLY